MCSHILVKKKEDICIDISHHTFWTCMVQNKVGSATMTNRSPSQTPRGRGNRQFQTSTNRINVRKALRLHLSLPQAR